MLNWIAKEYGSPPIMVGENGFSDHGGFNDTARIDFFVVSWSISIFVLNDISGSELVSVYATPSSTTDLKINFSIITQF